MLVGLKSFVISRNLDCTGLSWVNYLSRRKIFLISFNRVDPLQQLFYLTPLYVGQNNYFLHPWRYKAPQHHVRLPHAAPSGQIGQKEQRSLCLQDRSYKPDNDGDTPSFVFLFLLFLFSPYKLVLLTQKCVDAANTQQVRRSENKKQSLADSRSIKHPGLELLRNPKRASQFDP
jgi:hypothetical protein